MAGNYFQFITGFPETDPIVNTECIVSFEFESERKGTISPFHPILRFELSNGSQLKVFYLNNFTRSRDYKRLCEFMGIQTF